MTLRLEAPPVSAAVDATEELEPRERNWTRAEYYRLSELGFFDGQRVQLVDGKVWVVSPQGYRHSDGVELVDHYLRRAFSSGHRFKLQSPFEAKGESEPEPDVMVFVGQPGKSLGRHPNAAVIVVEVAEGSIRLDRKKASSYSASQIPEYWILNLKDKTLEVYRDPVTGSEPGYRFTRIYQSHETVAPLAAPLVTITVAELLP